MSLLVPLAKGVPVPRVLDDWYPVCTTRELRSVPKPVVLYDTPLVVFRDDKGQPAALLDRCAHRNVALSRGRITGACIECPYHGWQFDRGGVCRRVPALVGEEASRGRNVPSFACVERDGLVWVYATPDTAPVRDPFRFPLLSERGYTTVRQVVQANGSVHAVAENALDVPHTAFLHQGLFRADRERNLIRAQVRRTHESVEAEYIGEPRPKGLVGKVLYPQGGLVEHFDRFILPSVVQVEYRLGKAHFLVTAAALPISDYVTRLFASVSFRVPIPGWLLAPFLKPIALSIFRQDARLLAQQTEQLSRFGGEQYTSTEIDVLGPHIQRLLRAAERGDRTPGEVFTRTVELSV